MSIQLLSKTSNKNEHPSFQRHSIGHNFMHQYINNETNSKDDDTLIEGKDQKSPWKIWPNRLPQMRRRNDISSIAGVSRSDKIDGIERLPSGPGWAGCIRMQRAAYRAFRSRVGAGALSPPEIGNETRNVRHSPAFCLTPLIDSPLSQPARIIMNTSEP